MKLFKKGQISYKNHGRLFGWGSGADDDWRILFNFFLIILLMSVALSTKLFFSVKNDDLRPMGEETQINISKVAIKLTADLYTKRAQDFGVIQASPETSSDPSI